MSGALPSYGEAAAQVEEYASRLRARPPRTAPVSLLDSAGRVLAEPVRADRPMPSFRRSTRDGFACRAGEAASHQALTIAGSIRAGDPPAAPLPPDAVWEIMTGAAVPAGADAVVMLEHVEHSGNTIRLAARRTLQPGENIVPEGAEARPGDEIVPGGTRIGAPHIAAAAACGYETVEVCAQPRVGILTTGDELVDVGVSPGPGQIRNSNRSMLAALVARAGGDPVLLPAARDNNQSIDDALERARDADLLLVSGGVSAGKFDLVEPALARRGAQFFFTGVRIQPGKPLVFGELPRQISGAAPLPFFGLPGNPISSAATFLLFAVPILTALSGTGERHPRFVPALLSREVKGKPGLSRFVPSTCTFHGLSNEPLEVAPVPWQGSGDLAAFARSNCFLAVPEGADRLLPGQQVQILPFL